MADYNVIAVETASATDEASRVARSNRSVVEAASATDSGRRAVSSFRTVTELASALDVADAASHEFGISVENARARDSVSVALAAGRIPVETPTAVDEVEIGYRQVPRYVHVHHVIGKPAYVVSAFADYHGLAGPYHAVTLKQGRSSRVSAKSFETWEIERRRLAYMMERGALRVHEDYLGTRRELTPEQVDSYVADNAPWVTWVQHRAITGAPILPDAAPPTPSSQGVRCLGFDKVVVRVALVGGIAPDVDIAVWYRLPTATDRGTWTLVATTLDLANNNEAKFTVHYGELFVQLTDQDGDPTSATFYISGCSS
jgi:hypothetical protein